jgi:hypothetical protein
LNLTTKDIEAVRQYLLGRPPENGLTELEERILSDGDFYEELLAAEDDLIDQYLLGTLSESDRESFVSRFLITEERREKVRFSKTLRKYLNAVGESAAPDQTPGLVIAPVGSARRSRFFSFFPVSGHPAFRLSFAVVSLLLVFGASWIVVKNLLSHEKASDQPHSLFVATLRPGLTRDGGETTRISIPPDKGTVRLQLQLELSSNAYHTFSAELNTPESGSLLSRAELKPEVVDAHRVVNLDIPVNVLKAGDYRVRLSAVGESGAPEPVARYSFRVVN